MTPTINTGKRVALITALMGLLPVGGANGEPRGPELRPQPAIEASNATAASPSTPTILSLSDNPGPGETPGPPVYAGIAFFFMNGDWVAIEFARQRSCIPANFNLLAFADLPGAFACPLTFAGEEAL